MALRLRRALSLSYSLLERSGHGYKPQPFSSIYAARPLPTPAAATQLMRRPFNSETQVFGRSKGLLSSYSKSSGFQREVHGFSSQQREVHGFSSQQTGAKINVQAFKKEFSGRGDVHDKEKMLKIIKERVYNAEKLYRLMKDEVYAPRTRFNKKRTMKKVELPTHYAEVNFRTLTAVVFYKPNIDHLPLPKNHSLR